MLLYFYLCRMISKWYGCTLLVLISFIGLSFEQPKVVNQEIVLQFTAEEQCHDTLQQDVLATIIAKLKTLGVNEIEVLTNTNNRLSLRYFSAIHAQQVKELLTNASDIALHLENFDKLPLDFPEEESPEVYSLVVVDLQEASDVISLNGKLAFELGKDQQKLVVAPAIPVNPATVLGNNAVYEVSFKANRAIILALDFISHTFPEVRAGPLS